VRRLFTIVCVVAAVAGSGRTQGLPVPSPRPRLAVLIVVDQMRADYLQGYADRFHDGFKRLADRGAVFTEAWYPYASTKTAEAHALMLSGWSPSGSGIIGDSWYDRAAKSAVVAGASSHHRLLESSGEGGSPEQLLVHTVGDALKEQHPRSHVVTASWKRYSAVLNGGQHPDAAYWFDVVTGHMVTSDYYMAAYPAWVKRFDAHDLSAPYFGRPWLGHPMGTGTQPDETFRTNFRATPFSNEVLLAFAKSLIEDGDVGRDDEPDLVAISFSGLDYVGHQYGPETPEFDATIEALDRQIGDLLRTLDSRVGEGKYTVALTADHGAALTPEMERARGHDAGRLNLAAFRNAVEHAVDTQLGLTSPVLLAVDPPELYLDYASAAAHGVTAAALDHAVVAVVEAQPGIARAYTVDDVRSAAASEDVFVKAVADGFYAARSGDIHVLVKPNYIFYGGAGTTHGTPYEYDAHVPLILMGAGVKPGVYGDRVRINELAPTLGRLLNVPYQGDAQGRVLAEALGVAGGTHPQ
jgi:predicted AlkP superfamily pyrophosphatase or phosphodiesterase